MKDLRKNSGSVVVLMILIAFLGIIGYFYFQKSESTSRISNFEYRPTVQKTPTIIQTADTIEFTWDVCLSPKDDVAFQIVFPAVGPDSEKSRSILIADNIQNTGKFEWKIPTTIESGEYRFYISSNSCNLGMFAENNVKIQQSVKPFAVFITPSASEIIWPGISYRISWTSSENSNIDIGYRSTSVGEVKNIHWIAKNIKNNGVYDWTVPASQAKPAGWTEIILVNNQTGEQVSSDAFLIK